MEKGELGPGYLEKAIPVEYKKTHLETCYFMLIENITKQIWVHAILQ